MLSSIGSLRRFLLHAEIQIYSQNMVPLAVIFNACNCPEQNLTLGAVLISMFQYLFNVSCNTILIQYVYNIFKCR